MRIRLLLWLLFAPSLSGAAITYQDGTAGAYTTAGTVALNTSASSNDLIVAEIVLNNSSGTAYTVNLSDNVNTGNYTLACSFYNMSDFNLQFAIYYKVANASGTPTITATNFSTGGYLGAVRYNGFTGTPTLDACMAYGYTLFGTTVSSSALSTGHNNEEVVGFGYNSNGYAPTSYSPFTLRVGSANSYSTSAFDVNAATSGTNETLTFASSMNSGLLAGGAGFYGASSSCTHSGATSAGAIATPNGTTGSYRGKSGAFVTPDCATINYLQPTVGNFGTS
jgi:hypothetical protein